MKYNPDVHHRRSIRLKEYDYSQAGWYFVTICTQDHNGLFGDITQGKMNLNDAGKMVQKCYWALENKFPDIQCFEYVVMPNHFHSIIRNLGVIPNPSRSSLFQIIQWFKTMSTNEYIKGVNTQGWKRFKGRLWQRNYYEHIIRDEKSYDQILEYITHNPQKWEMDKYYVRANTLVRPYV